MSPELENALAAIAGCLDRHGVPFLVGGSALLSALGLVDEVRDLDLMFRSGDHDRLREAASGWWVDSTTAGTDLWASDWFARLQIADVRADAIGGMAFRHSSGVARLPFRAGGSLRVQGRDVPLAPPELWWAVYRAYQPHKARLLETVVDAEARRRVTQELGLAAADLGSWSEASPRSGGIRGAQ